MRLLILLFLSIAAFGQQIPGSRITDGTITEPKLAPNALRPISSGTLSSGELTFDEVQKKYTKTISADFALTLAASGNVADSKIWITFTGDGSHVVTFPASWKMTGTYSTSAVNKVELFYDGTYVFGNIQVLEDIIEVSFVEGVVDSGTPDVLNLTFDGALNITADGWTLEADGAPVDFVNVIGSGTATPAFTLVRDIIGDEVLTLSYNPTTGSTTSLTGNEVNTITDAAITGFPATPPVGAYDLYVDDDAVDDVAAGTIGDPYKTIQAASNAAVAGQVIGIRAGTYRQTIVAKTGVTYEEYTGEVAVVSGMEVVGTTGWTVHSGNIYKKTITLPVNGFNTSTSRIAENSLNTTIFANQILRNSVMMHEARWPNIGVNGTNGVEDLLLRSKYRETVNYSNGFNVTQLTDAGIPIASPGLVGATLVANGWISQEPRTILTHPSNSVVTYSAIWGSGGTNDWHRKRYYLTGKLALLDVAGEWHYESGTLYFYQPGGGTPTGTIEYKARNWGFDIRDKQNVTIKGLNFVGCEIARGNVNSSGAVIDGVTAAFQNHHVRHDVVEWQGVGMSKQFGTMLIGPNSIVKNSTIHSGGSQQVWLGENGRFENNTMYDCGYVGYWANGVGPFGNVSGVKILRNTISNMGRSCADLGFNFHYGDQAGAPQVARRYGMEIAYNDFSGWGSICQDVGATYTWGQCDFGPAPGLLYHHNWIHNTHAPDGPDVGANVGIYFDQATGPGRIHHNVVWDAGCCDMYHEVTNNTRPYGANTTWVRPNPSLDIYNNTFANTGGSFPRSYVTYEPAPFDKQRGNIYVSARVTDYGSDVANSIISGTNPQFLASGAGGLYYRPSASTPLLGTVPNNYAGNTGTIADATADPGAYVYNDPDPWIPGATAVVEEADGSVNDDDAGITYSTAPLSWYSATKANFTNGDYHATSALNATATYVFTGAEISVVAEKCDNMAIVRFQIFDDTSVNGTFTDQIGSNVDVDMYNNSGGTAQDFCPNGVRQTVFNVTGLAAGDKMIKMTVLTQNTTAVPARTTYVLDELIIVP